MLGIKTRLVDAGSSIPLVYRVASKLRTREKIFDRCYAEGLWGSEESGSGCGSELAATGHLRAYLPELFARYRIRTVLDAPCGDWNWMRFTDLSAVEYVGADIVPGVIARNQQYARPGVRFMLADLTRQPLPQSDLILCRDCWVHLAYRDIFAMLENFRRSGATWLLTSDTPSAAKNRNKFTGSNWRHLNLSLAPFRFPQPIERRKDHHSDVPFHISLWRFADLPGLLPT